MDVKRIYYLKTKSGLSEVEFLGVFQRSRVVDASPLRGGHPGGVVAYPVAVVKMDGKVQEVDVSDLFF